MLLDIIELPSVLDWLVLVWLLFFGACVGSFMNVVIYRLPAAQSIVSPGSRCPQCGHAIRVYDNVPVLSWLILRGRCRDCGVRISGRYPTVEALVALVWVTLGLLELVLEGINLPQIRTASLMPDQQFVLIITYINHVVLMSTLICAALIAYDGHRLPLKLFLPAVVVGIVLTSIWPATRPVPVSGFIDILGWYAGLAESAIVAVVAGALSLHSFSLAVRGRFDRLAMQAIIVQIVLCSLMLGWQAAAVLLFVSTALLLVTTLAAQAVPGLIRIPFSALLALATGIFVINWRWLLEWVPSLGRDAGGALFALCGISVVIMSLLILSLRAMFVVRIQRKQVEREQPTKAAEPTANDQRSD